MTSSRGRTRASAPARERSRRREMSHQLRSAAYRHRWYGLPTGTSAASLAAAGIGNLAHCEPITMGTSAVLMAATGWGGLRSARERALYAGISGGNLTWQAAAALAEAGPATAPLPALLAGGTIVSTTAWAWLRSQPLRAPDLARELRRWHGTDTEAGIFEVVGLDGCSLVTAERVYASKGASALPIGWDYRIELAHGKTTADSVRRVLGQLENALRVRAGAITVLEDADRRHQLTLRVIPVRVWSNSAPVNHPLLGVIDTVVDATRRIEAAAEAGDTSELATARVEDAVAAWMPRQRSVKDPLPLGVYEDGAAAYLDMWTPGHGAYHLLIGGQTGSGKTNLVNALLKHLTACVDSHVWGIDIAKSGRNLAPWEESLGWLAGDADTAMAMLRAASQAVADRGREYPIEDSPTLEPRPDRPLITLVVDEAAALLSESKNPDALEAADLVAQIAQQGRELGVQLILITQRPTVESLGGGNAGTILAQLVTRLCLKVTKAFEASFVLREWNAFDPSAFYVKGMVLVQTDEGSDPLPVRVYWSSNPKHVKRANALYSRHRPALDAPTERGVLAGAGAAWSNRRGCAGIAYTRRGRPHSHQPASAPAPEPAGTSALAPAREHPPAQPSGKDTPMPDMAADLASYMASNPTSNQAEDQAAGELEPTESTAGADIAEAAAHMPKTRAARAERTESRRASMAAVTEVYEQYRTRMAEDGAEGGAGIALAELARDHLGEDSPALPDDQLTAHVLAWLADCGERGESVQVMARKFGVTLREVSDRLTQVARSADQVERAGIDAKGHSWWRLVDPDAPTEADEDAESGQCQSLLDLLAEAGTAGAATSQLAATLNVGTHTVRRQLKTLEETGAAVRTGARKSTRWYVTEHAPTSDDHQPARV